MRVIKAEEPAHLRARAAPPTLWRDEVRVGRARRVAVATDVRLRAPSLEHPRVAATRLDEGQELAKVLLVAHRNTRRAAVCRTRDLLARAHAAVERGGGGTRGLALEHERHPALEGRQPLDCTRGDGVARLPVELDGIAEDEADVGGDGVDERGVVGGGVVRLRHTLRNRPEVHWLVDDVGVPRHLLLGDRLRKVSLGIHLMQATESGGDSVEDGVAGFDDALLEWHRRLHRLGWLSTATARGRHRGRARMASARAGRGSPALLGRHVVAKYVLVVLIVTRGESVDRFLSRGTALTTTHADSASALLPRLPHR